VSRLADIRQTGALPAPGVARAVAARGDVAYVSSLWRGFQTVDVADPTRPAAIGSLLQASPDALFAPPWTSCVFAIEDGRFYGIDVSDPRRPRRGAQFGEQVYSAATSGRHAYLGTGGGLAVVDARRPDTLPVVGRLPLGRVSDVIAAGGYALARVWPGSSGLPGDLAVVDVAVPNRPRLVAWYREPPRDGRNAAPRMATHGGRLYWIDGGLTSMGSAGYSELRITDVGDPFYPRSRRALNLRSALLLDDAGFLALAALGGRLYVSHRPADRTAPGLAVFDAAGLPVPRLVGHATTGGFVHDLALADGVLVAASGEAGVQVFELAPR